MAELTPGTSVDGKYTVLAPLGSGGHAHVFRVRHELLGQDRALKVLDLDAQRHEIRERFLQEARSIAMLDDPRIVKISDYGTLVDGRPFLILELVAGETLAHRLRRGAMAFSEAVEVAIQILEGLVHAHDHGIVHRDLKPQNIMLVDGEVKILDFGLALVEAFGAPEDGGAIGTPSYMAPEQATMEQVDARADLYAVGLVLQEMLTGRQVFDGGGPLATLQLQIESSPASLPDGLAEPWKSSALQAVLDKALDKDPDARHADAAAFIRALWPLRRVEGEAEQRRRIEESLATLEAESDQPRRVGAIAAGVVVAFAVALVAMVSLLG